MSTIASSSTASLEILEETTYGVIESTAPRSLRMLSEDLKFDVKSESTKEINDTRQVTDSIIVDAESGGGVNFELSYREYDDLLEALLAGTFNTFGTNGINTLTVTINKVAGTITDDGVDGFTGFVVGQWFSLSSTVANDGIYRIASMTNDVLTVDSSTPLLADETSTVGVEVSSTRLSNGLAALRSFSIQKKFSDVSQYFMFTGMSPSTFSLDFSTASIVSGNIGFLGKGSSRSNSSLFPGGAPTASQSFGVMNSVTGVGARAGSGAIIARNAGATELLANTFVQSMKLSVGAGLRGQKAIGVLGNAGVALGTFDIKGTLDVYLADGTIYDEALANNLVSIEFPVKDVNNNGYAFIFNNCKLGVPTVTAGGMDSDIVMSIPFTAVAPDTATDKMLIVDRFGAAPM